MTGTVSGTWTTFTNKGYDAVWTRHRTGTPGRLHHIAFAVDIREGILRAADLDLEQGVFIETGPYKHAIQQTFFLDVYEPGATVLSCATPGRGWCSRRTGSRSTGPRPTARRVRHGA